MAAAKLSGATHWALADSTTGDLIEANGEGVELPPASVLKIITALFALDRLGPDTRLATRVLATGPMVQGVVQGDLILAGGGDPRLDTDMLADLVARLAASGLRGVTGRYLYWAGALPALAELVPDQPVQVGYNPGLSGLNLNFNRVSFEWKAAGAGFEVQMTARGERHVPPVRMARMKVEPREAPLFTWARAEAGEDWTVAAPALNREGSRWLPVRDPGHYAAEVFATLAAAQGIDLPDPAALAALPSGTVELGRHESAALRDLVRDMLRFSNNMTAEALGLLASGAGDLLASGRAMERWAGENLGMQARFDGHSGLGQAARVTPLSLLVALLTAGRGPLGGELRGVLRDIGLRDDKGEAVKGSSVSVRAKSGTLNFVSGLAGFIAAPGRPERAFVIYSADLPRRDAVPAADREAPEGAKDWTRRAHLIQARLINRWARA